MTKPIINWDGKTIPEGLKQVPPGEYALETHRLVLDGYESARSGRAVPRRR